MENKVGKDKNITQFTLIKLNDIDRNKLPGKNKNSSYKVVGQFDQINITDIPNFKSNELYKLEKVYKSTLADHLKSKNGNVQIFYGYFIHQSDNYSSADWNYQFLSIIDTNIDYHKNISDIDNEFIENLDKLGAPYKLYKPVDRSQYILLIKAFAIQDGYMKISSLHFSKNIDSTFTILFINQAKKLDDFKNVRINQLKSPGSLENECIYELGDKIDYSINFKVKDIKAFHDYVEKKGLSDYFYVLGNSNVQIRGTNEPSYKLIRMINCKTGDRNSITDGCFDINDPKVKKLTYYVHTTIKVKSTDNLYEEIRKADKKATNNMLIFKIAGLIKSYNNKTNNPDIKNLLWVLQELIYDNVNNKDLVLELLPVIEMVHKIFGDYYIEDKFNDPVKEREKKIEQESIEYIIQEMNNTINAYYGSVIKNGHSSIYVPNVYYTPTKLIAYYNSYLNLLNKYYTESNGNRKELNYTFMVSPSYSTEVAIKTFKIAPEKKDRILIAEIPHERIFHLSETTFILTHEAGHYLPDKFRFRANRSEVLLKATISSIRQYLVDSLNDNEDAIEVVDEYILQLFKDIFESIDFNNDIENYMINTEKNIRNPIYKFLVDNQYSIINDIDEKSKLDYYTKQNFIEKYKLLIDDRSTNCLLHFYRSYEYFLRECYSDLFAINILDVSLDQYLDFYYRKSNLMPAALEFEELNEHYLTRLAIVLYAKGWVDGKNRILISKTSRLSEEMCAWINEWCFIQNSITNNLPYTIEDKTSIMGLTSRFSRVSLMKYFIKCSDVISESFKEEVEDSLWIIKNSFKKISMPTSIKELFTEIEGINRKVAQNFLKDN